MMTKICFFILILSLCALVGCHGQYDQGQRTAFPSADWGGFGVAAKTIYRTNWTPILTSFGVFGSIVAIGLGYRKLGGAVFLASLGTTVYVIVVAKYSWLIGLSGMFLGMCIFAAALLKYRETVFGFIDGVQDGKEQIGADSLEAATDREIINAALRRTLSAEAERLVKIRKKQLESKKNEAIESSEN